jgi:hypothetical protein
LRCQTILALIVLPEMAVMIVGMQEVLSFSHVCAFATPVPKASATARLHTVILYGVLNVMMIPFIRSIYPIAISVFPNSICCRGAATVKHGNQSKFLWRITLLPRQRTVIYIKLYATDHRNRRMEARKKRRPRGRRKAT